MTAADLRIEWMRLDDLVPAARNSRTHDLDSLNDAVDELGFTTELKLDERDGALVWGHGRRDLLRRKRDAGDEPPEGIRVDADGEWLVAVVRGWSSRDPLHADAVREADNFQGEKGGYDDAVRLDVLSDLAADRPDYLRGTGYSSDDLDRLLAEATGGTAVSDLDQLVGAPGATAAPWDAEPADPFTDRPRPQESGDDEQWTPGDAPDEGSTADPEGPGPLDVEPAWRTLQPLRARYHDGTPDGAQAVARWLKGHAKDVFVEPNLAVSWQGQDGGDFVVPGKWVTRDGQTGQLDVMTREEFEDRYVPANEPARRAHRDAKPVATRSGADLLRHGSGVVTAGHTAGTA